MDWGLGSRGWTAVDCGGSASLCAVSLKTAVGAGQRPEVMAALEQPSETGAADTEALRGLLALTPRGLPQLVTLPRAQYGLRVMPEPAVPPREMANSLRWAISVDSADPSAEINLAWMRIPTEEQMPARPRHLYAITTPTATLAAQLAAWRPAGLRPKVVDIRETALRNIAAALERPGEALALVAADAEGVGFVFTHEGSLYLDRYLSQPVAELAHADEAARGRAYERIAQQLNRSIDAVHRSYPFITVKRVVVAPMPDRPGLPKWLAAQVPLPVEGLDLAQLVDMAAVPQLADSPALQARCLVAIGAALRGVKAD
jgi:MSHA biogenesis protein MshI